MKAVRIGNTHRVKFLQFDNTTEFDVFKEGIGGGTLSAVYSASGNTTFYIDDEGKFKYPENVMATQLLYKLNPAFEGADHLAGPVVVAGGADDEGYTMGVHEEALKGLAEILSNEVESVKPYRL